MVSYNNDLAVKVTSLRNQLTDLGYKSVFEDKVTLENHIATTTDCLVSIYDMSHKYLVIVTCKKLLLDLEYLKKSFECSNSDEYEEELYICKESIKSLLNLMNSCSLYDYSYAKTIDPLKELKTMVTLVTDTPVINFLVETLLESLRTINDSVTEELILQKLLFIEEHPNSRFPDEYIFNVTKKVTSIMKKKATETKVKEK